jgi:hypothetical protein
MEQDCVKSLASSARHMVRLGHGEATRSRAQCIQVGYKGCDFLLCMMYENVRGLD